MQDRIKDIKRYKRMQLLTPEFEKESIDYHNYYRQNAEQQITEIMDSVYEDEDFNKSYINKINKLFENIMQKFEIILS